MLRRNAKRKIIQEFFGGILLFVFAGAMIWRAFRGFDWSDEAYYSAIVFRIIQGDALFKTSWDIHQLSAVILVPIYWLYTTIFGTTGLILFSRFLYLLVITGEAIWLYIKFSNKYNIVTGVLVSILLLSYASVSGLSYNTMMVEAFMLSILLLPPIEKEKAKRIRYILSGVFSGIAVQAYPSTLLVLILFGIYIGINEKDKRWKMLLYYVSGGLIVLLSFFIFLMINSSFDALVHNAKYLLMDPEHGEIGFSLREHYIQLRDLIINYSIYAFVFANLLAIVTWFTKGKVRTAIVFLSVLAVFTGLFFQWNSIRAGYGKGSIQYQFFFSIALCFSTLWLLDRCKWNNTILLFLGGVVGSIGVNISTNNDATFYVYPYMISAIGTVIYAGQLIKNSRIKDRKRWSVQFAAYLPAATLIIYAFISSFVYVYRDGELKTLNTRMTSGPAAGIYTTETRAKQYEETIQAINNYMPKEENILYTKLLPFGYLCSNAKPATPRLWRTNLDYPLFEEYYRNNPDKLPDAIYIVNGNYGITNSGIVIGEYMQNYIDSTPHKTIEIDCATIIKFK